MVSGWVLIKSEDTAQADPMPTAVIWGCLKAVVDVGLRD